MRIKELLQEAVSPRKKITKQRIDDAFGTSEIDLLALINNDKHELLTYIPMGVYMGYSNQAIVEFLQRPKDFYMGIEPKPIGPPFEGTGFVPSKRERSLDSHTVVNQINKRRIHEVPFSLGEPEYESDQYFERIIERITTMLRTDKKFQQRVLKVMRLVKKRYPSLYRDLPV